MIASNTPLVTSVDHCMVQRIIEFHGAGQVPVQRRSIGRSLCYNQFADWRSKCALNPLLLSRNLEAMPDDNNRYEVIDGELFMSKSPGVPHQAVSMNLTCMFLKFLEQYPMGSLLATPGVIFSDIDAVIPDLVFIRRERMNEVISGDRIVAAPDLIVEILSPGSDNRRRDRVAKRQLYAKFGVM